MGRAGREGVREMGTTYKREAMAPSTSRPPPAGPRYGTLRARMPSAACSSHIPVPLGRLRLKSIMDRVRSHWLEPAGPLSPLPAGRVAAVAAPAILAGR